MQGRVAYAAKRAIDVVVSSAFLVLFCPFLLLTAAVIRIETPGPALFKQERVGRGGTPFIFYKFRTMVDGNDPAIHKRYVTSLITDGSRQLAGDTGSFKIEKDPRVTKFGRILRRTSMDELPQLINVLKGEMSLVGPRPPLDYEVALYSERAQGRLNCLPGMTGLWQVSGRCQRTFEEMVDLDLEYQDNWSLALDFRILAGRSRSSSVGRGPGDARRQARRCGLGWIRLWGPNILRNYMELPTARVKWVCDQDAGKLAKAKKRYPAVQATADYFDILQDPR